MSDEYLLIDMKNMSEIFIAKKDFTQFVEKKFESLTELEIFIVKGKYNVEKHSYYTVLNRYFNKKGYSIFCVLEDTNIRYLVLRKGIYERFNHIWFNNWVVKLMKVIINV